jgi:hypothetical protein
LFSIMKNSELIQQPNLQLKRGTKYVKKWNSRRIVKWIWLRIEKCLETTRFGELSETIQALELNWLYWFGNHSLLGSFPSIKPKGMNLLQRGFKRVSLVVVGRK